jgi:hypothetical protein
VKKNSMLYAILIVALALAASVWLFGATNHFIRLTWTASVSSNVTQYNVYRATSASGTCGTFSQIGVTPAATLTYDDATAVQGTPYCYKVLAFNGVDESGDSNVAQATIPFPPQAPSGLQAVPK